MSAPAQRRSPPRPPPQPRLLRRHFCGTYLRNTARNRGLRDQHEHADQENLDLITTAHRETTTWASSFQ